LAPLFVAVSGDSAANAQNIETFASSGPGVVDVLLIVDDSGSMSEEQARLSAAAPALLARGDAAGADYHVGVTTTDPGPSPFPIGTLRGTPRYVTSVSATRIADLTAAVNQGVNGSGTEEGLAAAAAAVTDATLLAGTNLGFLRPNAELAVVILSDEEDFSPGTVTSYVQAMANRSIGIPGSLRIFGITGGPSGCNTPGGAADPGLRYEDAATQTGGFTRSICEADYTAITNEIADAIFLGTRAVYPLASRPAPGTVEVRINGTLLPATNGVVVNWGLDYQAAQLIFVGGNGPPAGAAVEVRYQSVCVPATCGNGSLQAVSSVTTPTPTTPISAWIPATKRPAATTSCGPTSNNATTATPCPGTAATSLASSKDVATASPSPVKSVMTAPPTPTPTPTLAAPTAGIRIAATACKTKVRPATTAT
jgi:hypothetical protein